QLPTRVGLSGLLAGAVLVTGGGLGAAAVMTLPAAGAATAQLPAAAVREQNVNAAGRIRVALPSTGVGVNGNVSVSNLPTNAAGRVRTQNGTGTWNQASGGSSNVGSTPVQLISKSGSGVFQGLQLAVQNAGSTGYANTYVQVVADGHVVFERSWFAFICCWASSPTLGATTMPNSRSMWFYPPGGIRFHHSFQVNVFQPAQNGGQANGVFAWYTNG
ncbi:MAG: hypothetical protein ACYCS7_15210, partial [Acidimicrobiales bacterium]